MLNMSVNEMDDLQTSSCESNLKKFLKSNESEQIFLKQTHFRNSYHFF